MLHLDLGGMGCGRGCGRGAMRGAVCGLLVMTS